MFQKLQISAPKYTSDYVKKMIHKNKTV